MEKRALIAIVLSMLILIASQYLMPTPPQKPAPEQPSVTNVPAPPSQGQEARQATAAPASPVTATAEAVTPAAAEVKVKIDTPLYSGEFSSRGGTVTGWKLHRYQDEAGLDISLIKPGSPYAALAIGSRSDFSYSDVNFEVYGTDLELSESRPTGTLTFTYTGQNYSISRKYTFYHDTYYFDGGLQARQAGNR
jgi:YidC/Oxa1 family membrane protein insertase